MTLRELVRRTRVLMDDLGGDEDGAWGQDDSLCLIGNVDLVALLDGARREYRVRNPIRDFTTLTLCRPTVLATDGGRLALAAPVLAVRSVRLDGDSTPLPRASVNDLEGSLDWLDETGTPVCWVDDLEDGAIRLVPAPATNQPLRLSVDRVPLEPLDWDAPDEEVTEIPAEHQDALRFWAAAQRYMTGEQGEFAQLAALWLGQFDQIAGPPLTARQILTRARMAAGPMTIAGLWPGRRRSM